MKFPSRQSIPAKKLTAMFFLLPAVALLAEFLVPLSAKAMTISSARDCDANAVIMCGALSSSELISKYNSQSSVQTIYNGFLISSSSINAMDSTAVAGTVTSSGQVLVNGNVVANNAVTAGRQNIGNSRAVTQNGVTFYTRPPSVSFASGSLSAFVVMNGNRFDFAIIASCGNPVRATAIVKPAAVHKPTPAVVTPPPAVQQQQQQKTVVVTNTVPIATPVAVPAPVPTPVPTPQPKQIPNTGVGDVVGFGSFVACLLAGR
jgi:hypothetical protein